MSNTSAAQRRLLEALAELQHTPGLDTGEAADPLTAMCAGLDYGINVALAADQPGIARIYACLGSLALAVREDLNQNGVHHG